ncbi:hypothetical protein CVT26_007267 [Gymnopilus dilepis]|uniref:Uncharacterized protein n=1 Tax=Gymnopilus dilepis TaxID=231916 RepID=A0A409VMA4_9AGAR|nr:hypothetical protein CVT26_007267 [Gymnopilus dilepis]
MAPAIRNKMRAHDRGPQHAPILTALPARTEVPPAHDITTRRKFKAKAKGAPSQIKRAWCQFLITHQRPATREALKRRWGSDTQQLQ